MNAQHTPGPWKFSGANGCEVYSHTTGKTVCKINTAAKMDGEALSNANLIATSPEVLEGLRNIVKMLDGSQPKDPVGALMAARYLVHLATGGKA